MALTSLASASASASTPIGANLELSRKHRPLEITSKDSRIINLNVSIASLGLRSKIVVATLASSYSRFADATSLDNHSAYAVIRLARPKLSVLTRTTSLVVNAFPRLHIHVLVLYASFASLDALTSSSLFLYDVVASSKNKPIPIAVNSRSIFKITRRMSSKPVSSENASENSVDHAVAGANGDALAMGSDNAHSVSVSVHWNWNGFADCFDDDDDDDDDDDARLRFVISLSLLNIDDESGR